MGSILRLSLAVLITLAFAGLSFAQATPATPAKPATPPEKMAPKKEEKAKTTGVTGEVVSVDAKAGTLTVKAKDKEMSFTAETKGAKKQLEKVKAGDRVRVSYTEKDGKRIARSVTMAKGEAKAKGMAKKEEKRETKAEKKRETK